MNDEVMHKQQKILGSLCILLPILSIGFGIIGWLTGVNPEGWYCSLSDTYYANSKMVLIGLLFTCGFFFWSYKGYDKLDNIFTTIAAIASFMIIAFPCSNPAYYGQRVGVFCLPINISHTIHSISAIILYLSFMIQIMRFRKHGNTMTYMKKVRNNVYLTCFIIMVIGAVTVFFRSFIPAIKDWEWLTLVGESMLNIGFGFAWLVKGECIKFLNDK